MLSPVPNRRRALAPQASKRSGAGARNDVLRLLRDAVLEYSSALEHEAAHFPCNVSDDPLEADERGRAVAAVHHQVFRMPLAIRLLVPALDGESGVRNVLHVSTAASG